MSHDPFIEPERYELYEEPVHHFDLSRREILKATGGGLVIVCLLGEATAQEESTSEDRRSPQRTHEIGAWLHIGKDDAVTVYTGKAEVGQDIRTSLTQVVAEELRVPIETIRLVMGDTALTPYDRGTFGSRTTPSMTPQIRRAAASARELLIDQASRRWNVDRASITAADGRIVHPDKTKSFSFGELTEGNDLVQRMDSEAPSAAPDEWKVCGRPAGKVNGRAIVTGEHRYPSDTTRPGMLHGKILRPPAFGATIRSINLSVAEAMDGVTVVRDGEFVGVAAADPLLATKALAAIQVGWDTKPQPSHKELYDHLKERASKGGGFRLRNRDRKAGSMTAGLQEADHKLKQTYTIAYIAHAPLEPRAAVAEWTDGRLAAWVGTQRPFGVRDDLAQSFRIPKDRVRVFMPDTGSGYGGKHTVEAAVEAARLAKAAGKPVKVVWSREEEFTWAYFRPAGVIDVESGARKDGRLTAWRFHNYNSGGSSIQTPYVVPNQEIRSRRSDSPLRQGSYRALASTANHFARETHMDQIARALDLDPLEMRLKNLEHPRIIAVLDTAARHFGWDKGKRPPGRGVGIACGTEKGSFVAACAEVSVDPKSGGIRLERIVQAFECGAIINPDAVKNQVEGAITMGLGGALFEEIQFENGRILNPRFSLYRVPRFADVPRIETVLIDRRDLPPVGAGETPIVAVAPAVGNAVFDATGKRICSMPMRI